MAQEKGIALITGINGYIASTTAKWFLDAGYNVRGTARSRTASLELLREVFGEYMDSGRFEVVEVKDITVDGAFDDAVKGVSVIAHLAAPVSLSFTEAAPVMHAATQGTAVVLASALKNAGPQMKTAVMMSSVAAVAGGHPPPYKFSEANWGTGAIEDVERLGDAAGGPTIYRASKTAAEKVFWDFKEKNKPGWAFAAVNPGFVSGPPLNLPKDPSKIHETVINVWRALSGVEPINLGGVGSFVDVRDVARTIVWIAENPAKADGERYLTIGGFAHEQKVCDALNKAYPERKGIIPVGTPGTYPPNDEFPEGAYSFDISKVPKATGQDWISYEQSVVDSAKAFERYL